MGGDMTMTIRPRDARGRTITRMILTGLAGRSCPYDLLPPHIHAPGTGIRLDRMHPGTMWFLGLERKTVLYGIDRHRIDGVHQREGKG